jgi:hypothetical protein
MWSKFIDWYTYMCLQRNYPQPGNTCLFWGLTCLVVSNHYGNRVVVLHIQDVDWRGFYIMLTGSYLKRWHWLPTFVGGFIDDQGDVMTRNVYVLFMSQMRAQGKRTLPITSIYTSMMQIDEHARKFKRKWWVAKLLITPDWLFEASRIKRAAICIQSQWRKCIASPYYTMCIKRLMKEYRVDLYTMTNRSILLKNN